MALGTNAPYINYGPQTAPIKELFVTPMDKALFLGKQAAPGYGNLPQGTVVVVNGSAAGNKNLLLPYPGINHLDTTNPGRALILADVANAGTTLRVLLKDSYKFVVGDDLILCRNNAGSPAYHNAGAITAIDRTSSPAWATITFTTAAPDVNFTVANTATCYVKSHTSSPFFKAMYIADQAVDTGEGADTVGAQVSVIVNNAILNLNALYLYDATAKSDLGIVEDGKFVILK